MRTSLLLIINFFAVVYVVAMPATAWTDIPNVEDPTIQKLGLWAVIEHNKQGHDGLAFQRVASAEKQYSNYQLLIHAIYTSQERGVFTSVVGVDESGNASKLISFEPII